MLNYVEFRVEAPWDLVTLTFDLVADDEMKMLSNFWAFSERLWRIKLQYADPLLQTHSWINSA